MADVLDIVNEKKGLGETSPTKLYMSNFTRFESKSNHIYLNINYKETHTIYKTAQEQ